MREGLARIDGPIVLLGHAAFYTRFGFPAGVPARRHEPVEHRGPEWMIRGESPPGEVRYPEAFGTHPSDQHPARRQQFDELTHRSPRA